MAVAIALVSFAAFSDALARNCKPRRSLPAISVKDMGPCGFNAETLNFAGNAEQQAACLLRPVARWAKLGPPLEQLPAALAGRVGQATDLPDRFMLFRLLTEYDFGWTFAANLWLPVSRAHNNNFLAPMARYMVIHDTAGPNLGRRSFPSDIDSSWYVNNFGRHQCDDDWQAAHVFVNRRGEVMLGHDFSKPWRGTKFERATNFQGALRGLFLHVELVQPRRRALLERRRVSTGPTPGFTRVQYDRLALIYTIASVRAGQWLIPAFHAVIDGTIRGGHDDPQNFELAQFNHSLERLLDRLDIHTAPALSLNP